MKKTPFHILVSALLIAAALTACTAQKPEPSSNTQNAAKKLTLVTTIYPFTDLAQKIVGDKANVIGIVPGGVEPHDYELTAQNIITIKSADIFVYNGMAAIEPWLPKVIPFIPAVTKVDVSSGVKIIENNPHYWLDPEIDGTIVDMLVGVLVQKDRSNAETYQKNGENIKAQLASIHQSYTAQLLTCELRDVIVSHDAYAYMASKYHFQTHPIAGLSPESEPDARTIAELISFVREKKIPYILFETLASPKIADTIARETGARTLVLNPIEGLTDEDIENNQDVFSIMMSNLSVLKKAMKCTP